MILDNDYKMEVVVIEYRNGILGDVFDSFKEFKSQYPDSDYRFGFCIVNLADGYIPDGCNDWNDSPEEALDDYYNMHKAVNSIL